MWLRRAEAGYVARGATYEYGLAQGYSRLYLRPEREALSLDLSFSYIFIISLKSSTLLRDLVYRYYVDRYIIIKIFDPKARDRSGLI